MDQEEIKNKGEIWDKFKEQLFLDKMNENYDKKDLHNFKRY